MAIDTAENDLRPEQCCHDCSRLVHAREHERRRIARELHDGIAQRLTVMALALTTLNNEEHTSAIHGRLAELSMQLAALGSELHRVSHDLHPTTLDQVGLEGALRAFCSELASARHLPVHLLIQNLPRPLSHDIELCLYRIAQEALNNVVRHSGATAASVRLEGLQDHLVLTVKDDGTGFDVNIPNTGASLGLTSMRERVVLVDGQILIRSSKGEGTRIDVRVPCRSAPPAPTLTRTAIRRASL